MKLSAYLQLLLFGLCGLDGVAILIFVLRKNDQDYDYDKIIKELNEQKEISYCKKELSMKLFKK